MMTVKLGDREFNRIYTMEDYAPWNTMAGGTLPFNLMYNLFLRYKEPNGLDAKELLVLYQRFNELWTKHNLPHGPEWEAKTRWTDCLTQRVGYLQHTPDFTQASVELFIISEIFTWGDNWDLMEEVLPMGELYTRCLDWKGQDETSEDLHDSLCGFHNSLIEGGYSETEVLMAMLKWVHGCVNSAKADGYYDREYAKLVDYWHGLYE